MTLPVVALVGRPNVGKSTLFNRLTHTKNALVADFPGLTRDRQYGKATFNHQTFMVVDTGGIGVDDQQVDTLMSKQSAVAMDEADVICLVVDAQTGLTAVDESVAIELRKLGKPVVVVVNKTDHTNHDLGVSEFYRLGIQATYGISATHGRGIPALLDYVTEQFPPEPIIEASVDTGVVKVAIIGRPNVGKSTLINRLLGEERVVVYDLPGTTRDSIEIPYQYAGKEYILVDTAGVRRRARVSEFIEKFSIVKTLRAIDTAHVCVMMLDGREGITDQDLHLLGLILEAGKGLVIAINKWDGLDEEQRVRVRSELARRLTFISFAKIAYISALHGSGVGLLFKDVNLAFQSATQPLSTPHLTRILEGLVTAHNPPTVNGRRIKLRYAHAGGHNPPVIVIHGNQLNELPQSYKRYLMKGYIDALGLVGTPVQIEFKQGDNPFKEKRNTLTKRQLYKKKRLLKRVKKS